MKRNLWLSFTLIATLTLPSTSSTLAADSPSASTNVATGLADTFKTANSLMGGIANSQEKMQTMVNQLSMQQAAMQGMMTQNGQPSAFANAMAALNQAQMELQQCLHNSTKDTSKYKKAKINPGSILSTAPTCSNYGNLIDSIRKNRTELEATSSKMKCVKTFQEKVDTIMEQAKAPFASLTSSAQEIWNTRDSLIKMNQEIADNIKTKLDGPDGKSGFRKQVADLEKLALDMNSWIGGGPGKTKGGETSPGGFGQQLKDLKRQRVDVANQWYGKLSGEVSQCFYSDITQPCFTGVRLSPRDCIAGYINNPQGRSQRTHGAAFRAKADAELMRQLDIAAFGVKQSVELPDNLDVKNPASVMAFTRGRFNQSLRELSNNFLEQPFSSGVDKQKLTTFMRQRYQACYLKAEAKFKAAISTEGSGSVEGPSSSYRAGLNQVLDKEKHIATELKTVIEDVSRQMNDFSTAFSDVYNMELPQMAANCTAEDDPYKNLDCLKVMQANLKTGLTGTQQTIELDGGRRYQTPAGSAITMNIQTLSTDQAGKPSLASKQVQCTGFKGCLQQLGTYQGHYEGEVKKQEQARTEFVNTHNKSVDAAVGQFASLFGNMNQAIVAAVGGINEDLKKAGLTGTGAQVKTKVVKGEKLTKDEKTGLYETPENMKGALAANTGFSEIDDTSSVNEAYQTRLKGLNDLEKEAAKKKGECAIRKQDYEAIGNRLDCSVESVCDGSATSLTKSLERIFHKSQSNPDPKDKDEISDAYDRCLERATDRASSSRRSVLSGDSGSRDSTSDVLKSVAAITGGQKATTAEEKAAQAKELAEAKKEEQARRKEERDSKYSEIDEMEQKDKKACTDKMLRDLGNLGENGRNDTYKKNNSSLMSALSKMTNACAKVSGDPKKEENEDALESAKNACEAAKKATKSASIPDEGETPKTEEEGGSSTPSVGNPLRNSVGR